MTCVNPTINLFFINIFCVSLIIMFDNDNVKDSILTFFIAYLSFLINGILTIFYLSNLNGLNLILYLKFI